MLTIVDHVIFENSAMLLNPRACASRSGAKELCALLCVCVQSFTILPSLPPTETHEINEGRRKSYKNIGYPNMRMYLE